MSNSYVESVEQIMNTQKSQLQFEVKQKIYHLGCGLNGRIARRMIVDDGESTHTLYDIIVAGREPLTLEGVSPTWLQDGHLRED